MATTLDNGGIRLFDYATQFAQPFRESIRAHAERVAAEEGIEVEYIKKPKGYRKEDRIREIVAKRGTHPGLVHVFSVMELCSSDRPWPDKRTGLTHLRPDGGKCVYCYFYFIDEELGLCFLGGVGSDLRSSVGRDRVLHAVATSSIADASDIAPGSTTIGESG